MQREERRLVGGRCGQRCLSRRLYRALNEVLFTVDRGRRPMQGAQRRPIVPSHARKGDRRWSHLVTVHQSRIRLRRRHGGAVVGEEASRRPRLAGAGAECGVLRRGDADRRRTDVAVPWQRYNIRRSVRSVYCNVN